MQATLDRLASNLTLNIRYEGFHAPGCEFDLDVPSMQALSEAHRKVNGEAVRREATTATTDARHFRLMLETPVTCYGPQARNIHAASTSRFPSKAWCASPPRSRSSCTTGAVSSRSLPESTRQCGQCVGASAWRRAALARLDGAA
ncbi:hypothetical protein ACU4GD_24690 [Cupriavidus basilensis]